MRDVTVWKGMICAIQHGRKEEWCLKEKNQEVVVCNVSNDGDTLTWVIAQILWLEDLLVWFWTLFAEFQENMNYQIVALPHLAQLLSTVSAVADLLLRHTMRIVGVMLPSQFNEPKEWTGWTLSLVVGLHSCWGTGLVIMHICNSVLVPGP